MWILHHCRRAISSSNCAGLTFSFSEVKSCGYSPESLSNEKGVESERDPTPLVCRAQILWVPFESPNKNGGCRIGARSYTFRFPSQTLWCSFVLVAPPCTVLKICEARGSQLRRPCSKAALVQDQMWILHRCRRAMSSSNFS
jgi:hypothetical protein